MPKLVIWGAGGHARVVADIVQLAGEFEIIAFLEEHSAERHGTHLFGAPIVGGRESLPGLRQDGVTHAFIAIGDCAVRLRLAAIAQEQGFRLALALHPRAIIARDVIMGNGSVVMAGAIVNPGARIGENVIVNTAATVDHDGDIGAGAHIAPGVHLAGDVTVGAGAYLGIGSVVREGIHIGTGAMVGAGSVVVSDIPDRVLAYGVPARVIGTLPPP